VALQDKMKIDDMLKIRRMGKQQALLFVKTFHLDDEETEQALRLAMDEEPKKEDDARLWMAVAHILGASFAEIAADYGIARQSVLARVDRILPVTVRAKKRIAFALPLEHYSEYKLKFFENVDTLRYREPLDVGVWLVTNTELDKQETPEEEAGAEVHGSESGSEV
jgi:hypothetical protein